MASLLDIQNAMVQTITIAVYPNGTASPSIINKDVFIYPGDPIKSQLDSDLLAGKAHIAVFPDKAMTRNVTKYRDQFADAQIDDATIFLNILNNTVTVNGTVTVGQVSMIILNGVGFAYSAQQGDTLNTIAAALANMMPGASVLNNVITISDVKTLQARVSVLGSMRRILNTYESIFRARIIASSYPDRETLGNAIVLAFAKLNPRYYLAMPDGISVFISLNTTQEINSFELDLAFNRDYLFLVRYNTVDVEQFQTIADPYQNITVSNLPIS